MGMPKIELRLQMFRGDWDQIWSQQRMLWVMEALCRVNQTHLRQMNSFKSRGLVQLSYPVLYKAGIHYETEKGTEIWPDIPSLLAGTMGTGIYPGVWGDCEDLACYRVAEYRELPWHYARERKWDGKTPESSGKGLEVADPRFPQIEGANPWAGWKKVNGGIKAKPFAKWRRGPQGNYHYHALCLTGDGRLEDPSLVLGMGREKQFADDEIVEKLRTGVLPVKIQYAVKPDVMVVDPEKPSGYAGGKAAKLDAKVVELAKKGKETTAAGELDSGAYANNEIPLGAGEFDIDQVIGWNRAEECFEPKTDSHEARRLLGYANH